jgi:hypothetical protein
MKELHNKTFLGEWRELNSQTVYRGTLSIDLEGHSRIFSLEEFPKKWRNSHGVPETIIGHFCETITRKFYTIILYNNIGQGTSFSAMSSFYLYYELTLISENLVEGISSLDFISIFLSSKSLDDKLGGKHTHIDSDWDTGKTTLIIDPSIQKREELFENNEIKICFHWYSAYPLSKGSSLTIINEPSYRIDFKTIHGIESCFSEKLKAQQLFSILSKKRISFERFDLKHSSGSSFSLIGLEATYDNGIRPSAIDNLFERRNEIFERWFQLQDNIGFALENFHEAFVSKRFKIKNKFLAYCFSLELLHRECFFKKETLSKKHSRIIMRIAKELEGKGDLETWFSKYTNTEREVSFKERLSELITHSKLQIDVPDFAKRVVDTRNKYVHLDDDSGNPFNDSEMTQHLHILSDLFIEIIYIKISD